MLSARKILNELSSTDQPQVITVQAKVEADESNGSQTSGAEEAESSALSSSSTATASAVQYAGAGVTGVDCSFVTPPIYFHSYIHSPAKSFVIMMLR